MQNWNLIEKTWTVKFTRKKMMSDVKQECKHKADKECV